MTFIKCPKCGKALQNNSLFCTECGKRLNRGQSMQPYFKGIIRYIPLFAIVLLISCFIVGILCYNEGVIDNQPKQNSNSPFVYVTKSGKKYHKKSCDYINDTSIGMVLETAEKQGYSPCSKCNPNK